MFVLWLGERITDKGIGNGISMIIMIGIIARLPHSFLQEFASRINQQGGGLVMFLVEFVILFFVFMASILLVQGTRKNSGAICKTDCRKQTVWRSTSVHSSKSKCCRCYAHYFCPGNHDGANYAGRVC